MAKINTIEQCLAALGVSDNLLAEREKRELDEQGYVVFPGLMDPEWVERLRDSYERIMAEEGELAGTMDGNKEPGARRPGNLVNQGEVFDLIYTHPKVLAAVHYVLRRAFKLSNFCGRDAMPGMGHQAMHVDWGAPLEEGEPFHAVNTVWLLDDFSEANGATRVVPGSHKWTGPMDRHYKFKDKFEKHPQQTLLEASKGSVAILNLHLWHGGTQNNTAGPRRGLFAHFNAREHAAHVDHRRFISEETLLRISEPAKYMLEL